MASDGPESSVIAAVLFFFSERLPIDSDCRRAISEDVKPWQKQKRQSQKGKKAKKEPTAAECIENLLTVHILQGALLKQLKKTMQPKRKTSR